MTRVQVANTETARERYCRLRDEIVASGLPLLGDEELRNEIGSRKGNRELAKQTVLVRPTFASSS